MKRTNKKLSLRSETLRSLTPGEMNDAGGAGFYPVYGPVLNVYSRLIYCPAPVTTTIVTKPSLVDGCPSALGCTISIVINPGY